MVNIFFQLTATFEEALELEQMYSSHRDSSSFRAAQAQKQKKTRSSCK